MDDDAFDSLMASLDPPMAVVTTAAGGIRAGSLIGFHVQSSVEGQHYCLWLSKANHTYRTSLRSRHLALHFLTRDDLALAERFGTRCGAETDKFAGLDVETDEYDVPLLGALPHRLLLDHVATLDDGGDHVCVTTRVRSAATTGRFSPLRLADVDHLEPGHAAEERAVHP